MDIRAYNCIYLCVHLNYILLGLIFKVYKRFTSTAKKSCNDKGAQWVSNDQCLNSENEYIMGKALLFSSYICQLLLCYLASEMNFIKRVFVDGGVREGGQKELKVDATYPFLCYSI